MSVFRCQDLAPRFPDTRNLTPETFKLRYCCPGGAIFTERGLGKSIAPVQSNLNQAGRIAGPRLMFDWIKQAGKLLISLP